MILTLSGARDKYAVTTDTNQLATRQECYYLKISKYRTMTDHLQRLNRL